MKFLINLAAAYLNSRDVECRSEEVNLDDMIKAGKKIVVIKMGIKEDCERCKSEVSHQQIFIDDKEVFFKKWWITSSKYRVSEIKWENNSITEYGLKN